MAGEHEAVLAVKSYVVAIPAPPFGFLAPVESIVSFDLPRDSQFLSATVAGNNITFFFFVEVAAELVPTRLLLLQENQTTKRQDIDGFLLRAVLTAGTRFVFLLGNNP